jgi:hypothetical protein
MLVRGEKDFCSTKFGIAEIEDICVCEEDMEMSVLVICDVLRGIDYG